MKFDSPYGELLGAVRWETYGNGNLREVMLNKPSPLQTPYGTLMPKYSFEKPRDKYRPVLAFYPSGMLKSIYLEKQIMINTPIGMIQAEMLTFYEDGSFHRVFPSYGQVGGYWSEKEEKDLVTPIDIQFAFGRIHNKMACCFYPDGKVKSLTLYTGERAEVMVNNQEIGIRIGIALYEDGKVKSVEPVLPVDVNTPIGIISAYDSEAVGIEGDLNSLVFDKKGHVLEVTTITSSVEVPGENGEVKVIKPERKTSPLDMETKVIVPIRIKFKKDKAEIWDSDGKVHVKAIEAE